MITKFRLFENFDEDEWGEIRVVAITTPGGGIIKGHTYVVTEFTKNGGMRVKDIFNNTTYYGHEDWFVSENEYKYPEINKFNL